MAARILHIIIAISVFFSTTGLIVIQHYCNQELKKIGLFVGADNCSEASDLAGVCCLKEIEKKCCQLPLGQEKENNCCDTKTAYYKVDQELKGISKNESEIESLKIILPNPIISLAKFSFPKYQNFPFQNYKTPFIVNDFPVLFQSFLC